MKTLIRLLLGFSLTACLSLAAGELSNTSFVVGQTIFKPGDAITIQQVLATSPNFAVGDKVVVRGQYQLKSKDKAKLALFLTQIGDHGKELVAPAQVTKIAEGSGTFELVYEIAHAGALHLTFYSIPEGKPFGGVYFGTASQMKTIESMTLSDYEK